MNKNNVNDTNTKKSWLLVFFRRVNIDEQVLKNDLPDIYLKLISDKADTLLPTEVIYLLNFLAVLTGNNHIGIELAKNTHLCELGLYGFLLESSLTLSDFLVNSTKYYPLVYRSGSLDLSSNNSRVIISYQDIAPTKSTAGHDNEWTIGFYFLQVASKLPKNWYPKRVNFSHKRPNTTYDLESIFGPNLFFEQVTNSFEVENEFLNMPFNEKTKADQRVINIYHQEAESIINSITYSDCLENQLRMYLFTKLSEAYVSTDYVAKVFNMSESTLKRKLNALGTTFSKIRDEVMLHLAKKLLTEKDIPINQVALNVGYSEHSAFNHAFLRLTSYTPSQYRNESLTSKDNNKVGINA